MGKMGYQAVQGFVKESPLSCFLQIGSLLGWVWSEKLLRVRLCLGHGPPDGSLDGRDSVGGESCAACGVITQQSPPQADSAYVQGLGVGEIT
jgi:hypothetical protein